MAGWIRQREDDRSIVQLSHPFQNGLVEDPADRRHAHDHGRLDVFDNLGKGLELLALIIIAREILLVLREFVTSVIRDQSLDI